MGNKEESSERAEPHNFAFQKFQDFQESNPEIAKAFNRARARGSELASSDFLKAMSVMFKGLQSVEKLLDHQLPRISSNSSGEAWRGLGEVPNNALDDESFDQFRETIDCEFRPTLNESIASLHVRRLVEHIFAVILRMIQLERARSKELRAAD
ncbi:hypothetical protein HZB93_01935 [Candidatus Falkowbacteria bacterium]|nr:hypothetical protein [Candidatus Falkowbacteria bacterium]